MLPPQYHRRPPQHHRRMRIETVNSTAYREFFGNICRGIPFSWGEYAGRSLCFFSVRLGKVSLSRVCHPQPSPVPPRNSAPAFLLGRSSDSQPHMP